MNELVCMSSVCLYMDSCVHTAVDPIPISSEVGQEVWQFIFFLECMFITPIFFILYIYNIAFMSAARGKCE